MFAFVVRNLRFLKHVPVLPHIFDSLLLLRTFVFKHRLLNCFDNIESEVLSWSGTSVSVHKYGGLQYNVNHKEIGHLHSNGLLDVLFSKKVKQNLIAEGKVKDHHVFQKSGWISFYIDCPEDGLYAIKLLKRSYAMKNS